MSWLRRQIATLRAGVAVGVGHARREYDAPFDRAAMLQAISLAERCNLTDPASPRVGAVIVLGRDVISIGCRQEDGEHAEKVALDALAGRDLSEATVYTTLEPCTRHVRREIGGSCADRLVHVHPRRVVIGILDPNQGVCGRGVLQLQRANIEVDLFPHDLAQRVGRVNDAFIRAQQGFGVRIVEPRVSMIELAPQEPMTLRGTLINPPSTADLIVLMSRHGNEWFLHERIATSPHSRDWSATILPLDGRQTLVIVRATEAGRVLLDHMTRVVAAWIPIGTLLAQQAPPLAQRMRPVPLSITMAVLPKGIDVEDSIDIEVRRRPHPA